MAAIPTELRPRLAKIVKMLGGMPGDVVAAATALQATLSGAGCDLHDLAALIEGSSQRTAVQAYEAQRETYRRTCATEADIWQPMSKEDRLQVLPVLEWGLLHNVVPAASEKFIQDMVRQFREKPGKPLSGPQERWLTRVLRIVNNSMERAHAGS